MHTSLYLAISVETDYDFEGSELGYFSFLSLRSEYANMFQIKAYFADPSAFALAASEEAPAASAVVEEEAPAIEEEESDDDMGLDLFG